MRALLRWELQDVLRCPVVAVAAVVHAGIALAFVIVWTGGVPLWPERSVLDQVLLVQVGVLGLLLPWLSVRVQPVTSARGQARLAALVARPTSHLVLARTLAIATVFALLVATAVPLTVLARQSAGVPVSRALPLTAALLGVSAVSASTGVLSTLLCRERLVAWASAGLLTGLVAAVAMFSFGPVAAAGVMFAVAGAAAWVAAFVADRRWRDADQ